jgi:release factor glutamine methyltransferase
LPAQQAANTGAYIFRVRLSTNLKLLQHKIIKFALMTVEQIYKEYIERLTEIYDEREAVNIAEWTLENITGVKKIDRVLNKQKQVSSITTAELHKALDQLLKHRPVQYVLSEAWFYKMKFFVNEHVLIPRPETEELVEWIVEGLKIKNEELDIIDIGTGSGCIAIALKRELTHANVLGIDVSADALKVAKQNAANQNLNIDLSEIDFLETNTWQKLPKFDIIASNPPYIPENEKKNLEENVVAYEPHLALFVSDNDPCIFYKRIAEFSLEHLKANGKIYVEVHEKGADKAAEIFSQYHFTSTIKKDIYGKERMICAER